MDKPVFLHKDINIQLVKMGQVFGSAKPLKEIVRENQRMVKKAVRELDREVSNMQSSVKKLEKDMRAMAKQGQMVSR
jgi:charged multivesicular body protein 2A